MHAAEYARQGKDWETELRQRAKEVALMKELGLTNQETVAPRNSDDQVEEGRNRLDVPEGRNRICM